MLAQQLLCTAHEPGMGHACTWTSIVSLRLSPSHSPCSKFFTAEWLNPDASTNAPVQKLHWTPASASWHRRPPLPPASLQQITTLTCLHRQQQTRAWRGRRRQTPRWLWAGGALSPAGGGAHGAGKLDAHICTNTHLDLWMHTNNHTQRRVHNHTGTYTQACARTHVHARTFRHAHVDMRANKHKWCWAS